MTPKEYIKLTKVTDLSEEQYAEVAKRLSDPTTIKILHSVIGLVTESAELMDAMKKHLFYGKPLDLVNVFEEFGDVQWYVARGLESIDKTFEDAMETNIKKLKARFGDKFSSEKALNRDLDIERKILEE